MRRPLVPFQDPGVDGSIIPVVGLGMNTYPADEKRISEVERGRSYQAVLPFPPGKTLAAGDTILFALAHNATAGQAPNYVKGGDSVMVSLIDVVELGQADPSTGQPLFQITWKRLGPDTTRPE